MAYSMDTYKIFSAKAGRKKHMGKKESNNTSNKLSNQTEHL